MFNESLYNDDMPVNLLRKIMIARKKFKDKGITKSGYNKFQNFHYYELKDIIPEAIEICLELNLATQFTFENNRHVLKIYDLDNKEVTEFAMSEKDYSNDGNINVQLQNLGKIQTYIRRYLYMQFLDITETDVVDSINISTNPKTTTKPKFKHPIS